MTKKSVKSQTPRMSRIVTSVASFSWQRAAVRRACSSGVRSVSLASSSIPVAVYSGLRRDRDARSPPRPLEARAPRSAPRAPRARGSATRRSERVPARTRRYGRLLRGDPEPPRTSSPETPGRMATPRRTSSRTRSGDFQLSKSASSSAPRMKTASSGVAPRASRPCGHEGRARRRLRERPRKRAARARAAPRPEVVAPCARDSRRRGRGARRVRALDRRASEGQMTQVRRIEDAAEDA